MSDNAPVMLTPGTYEHYKGKRYRVLGVGRHTETEELVVVYEPLYQSEVMFWVRPYAMFVGKLEKDGKLIQRFRKIDE